MVLKEELFDSSQDGEATSALDFPVARYASSSSESPDSNLNKVAGQATCFGA